MSSIWNTLLENFKLPDKHVDKIHGGLADKKEPKDFDEHQLRMGIKIEMEHTDDKWEAMEIAMDHLVEDPQYYTHLIAMEKEYQGKDALKGDKKASKDKK